MGFDIGGCVGDTGSRNLFLSSDQLGLMRSKSDERIEGLTKSLCLWIAHTFSVLLDSEVVC